MYIISKRWPSKIFLTPILARFQFFLHFVEKMVKLTVKTPLGLDIQWNLSKADTYGTEVFVHFREVSALERFELKSSQI